MDETLKNTSKTSFNTSSLRWEEVGRRQGPEEVVVTHDMGLLSVFSLPSLICE